MLFPSSPSYYCVSNISLWWNPGFEFVTGLRQPFKWANQTHIAEVLMLLDSRLGKVSFFNESGLDVLTMCVHHMMWQCATPLQVPFALLVVYLLYLRTINLLAIIVTAIWFGMQMPSFSCCICGMHIANPHYRRYLPCWLFIFYIQGQFWPCAFTTWCDNVQPHWRCHSPCWLFIFYS